MVSAGVSKLGKTSIYFVELGARMTTQYYRENILENMLPEIEQTSEGDYIFQQDGARPHTAKATIDYLNEHCPNLLEPRYWLT